MINPAEDIVSIWLQECRNHFTMGNITVPKLSREVNNRKIYGGRGKEIDIISTNGKNFYWVEVSVSPSPYLTKGEDSAKGAINKFAAEKEKYLNDRFGKSVKFKKWFVYSPKLFSKKSGRESKYCAELKRNGIEAVSFSAVLDDLEQKINYMGYDLVRNYLFLLKKFNWGDKN